MKRNLNAIVAGALLIFSLLFVVRASEPPEMETVLQPGSKSAIDETQGANKAIVLFNNFYSSSEIFGQCYWSILNGDYGSGEFADEVMQTPFSDNVIASMNVKDHEVYIFPLGDNPLEATMQAGKTKVIDFIKMALNSGRKVIVFSHKALRNYTSDADVKDFIENILMIEYKGLKPLLSGTSRTAYYVKGLGGDPLGLGLFKWFNCTSGSYAPLIWWDDVETFRSKDALLCPTFDYIASSGDESSAVATDSAVGTCRVLSNSGKVVFYSYDLVNMSKLADRYSVLYAAIRWSLNSITSVPEMNNTFKELTISVSPNPANGSAVLKYNLDCSVSSELTLILADNLGNIVRTLFDGRIDCGEGSIRMDMSGIASGSYSIIAEIHGEVVRLPLIVIK